MAGGAFYFHFGLVTRKIYVTHFMNSLRKRISVFHDLMLFMFQLNFLSVSSSSSDIHCKSECWNQRHIRVGETSNTNTSTHKLKPKSSVHNFEMSETLLEERHFNLATKQEIKWAIVEYNLCDTSINVWETMLIMLITF